MTVSEYLKTMKPGLNFGDGVRLYTLESVTEELTTLRGTPQAKRQDSTSKSGSKRAIPTEVILDIVNGIEAGKIEIEDIMRGALRKQGRESLFQILNLDHDPFILGYDSTIFKICNFLINGETGSLDLREEPDFFDPTYAPFPKPFLLLAGISGTGKTQWVTDREIAAKNNVKVIAVRPDWHEPSDLLGYVSRISNPPVYVTPTGFPQFLVKAWLDCWEESPGLNPPPEAVQAMTPHWLCLDEMNLAPVEQYFSEYLSVLEGRVWTAEGYSCPPLLKFGKDAELIRSALDIPKADPLWNAFMSSPEPGIPLPPNLIVVGTVNMDETTHGFSRKVLDRALTVEFDEVDFSRFGGSAPEPGPTAEIPWTGLSVHTDANDLDPPPPAKAEVLRLLEHWNRIMAHGPFRIAYRAINESLLMAGSLQDKPAGEVLDWVAMTKLLPRLEGDEEKLRALEKEDSQSVLDRLLDEWPGQFGPSWEKSRTKAKLKFMDLRLKQSSYTSFWP